MRKSLFVMLFTAAACSTPYGPAAPSPVAQAAVASTSAVKAPPVAVEPIR